ncbi:LysR family transcriptional regulator [Aliamphritea spongicola]|nr:LysR family transcriptional regulator [Aliamphritea spongicola]
MLLKDRLPSPQSLLVFEAAARHLSFTAAARELSSTQSAVSQLMRGLEAQLELQLFRRIYRGRAD